MCHSQNNGRPALRKVFRVRPFRRAARGRARSCRLTLNGGALLDPLTYRAFAKAYDRFAPCGLVQENSIVPSFSVARPPFQIERGPVNVI